MKNNIKIKKLIHYTLCLTSIILTGCNSEKQNTETASSASSPFQIVSAAAEFVPVQIEKNKNTEQENLKSSDYITEDIVAPIPEKYSEQSKIYYQLIEYSKNLDAIKKLVDKDNSYGYTALGYYYFTQEKGPEALLWFETAAVTNNPYAENRLGELYVLGRGVPADSEKAKYWFERSGAHGYAFAAFMAGLLYSNTILDDKNTKLTPYGDIDSFDTKYLCIGKKPNVEKAEYWFLQAEKMNYPSARAMLEQLHNSNNNPNCQS